MGVVPEHKPAFVAEHWAQAPEARQAGAAAKGQAKEAAEPLSPLQPVHVPVAVLHLGVVPEQSVAFVAEHWAHPPVPRHAGADVEGHANDAADPLSPLHAAQLPVDVLHNGVVPEQRLELVPEHCAHAPEARHAGAVAKGHTSVAAEPLSPLHPAQVPVAGLHSGVAPEQSVAFVAEHGVHAPVARHAGAAAEEHGRVAVDPLSPLHAAQVSLAKLQSGVVPEQRLALVAEHCAQAPVARQAGTAAEGHARDAPEPLSPLQPAQVPVAVLQRGVVPVQRFAVVGEHCAHAPEARQAGVDAVGHARDAADALSPLHATQPPVSHTGALTGQLALDAQLHR